MSVVRYIAPVLIILLLPSMVLSGNLSRTSCSACDAQQVISPDCCNGTEAHTMGDSSDQSASTATDGCIDSLLCLLDDEVTVVVASTNVDAVVPPVGYHPSGVFQYRDAVHSTGPILHHGNTPASLYILHCAFLI